MSFVVLFCLVDDVEPLMEILKQAAKEGAMVGYTLADPSMAEAAKQACKLWGLLSIDEYFRTIEAIEFTIKQEGRRHYPFILLKRATKWQMCGLLWALICPKGFSRLTQKRFLV
ncbi:hypothetical protein G4B88_018827 [Cannabis sativa]|uniref:Uncharacterized protein n=1 Tax=Cannabis sativa TaxID=3483 RepID=A0A7J6DUD1_CANSA|nr:hypothetical protein G4B88_018827 [Cannabis sativa]